MRVIAGSVKSQIKNFRRMDTRPTTDRIKENTRSI